MKLTTRLILVVIWLLSGVGAFSGIGPLRVISAIIFLGLGVGMGIILFGDPLPLRKKQILCARCRTEYATSRQHYWTTSYTVPAGSVALCDHCSEVYDHNKDWARAERRRT